MTGGGSVRSAAVDLRPELATDEPIVRLAHVEHRRAIFAALPWPPDALEQLCLQQHDLQERHISTHHPLADRMMIDAGGRAAGRLCLDRSSDPWRIVDIALAPEAQNQGIGSAAIRRVLDEADIVGVGVELQVALDNPRAEALYRRLGFRDSRGSAPTHRLLSWSPGHAPQLKTA